MKVTATLLAASFAVLGSAACGAPEAADEANEGTTDESELRAMTPAEMVGSIAFGETKAVDYAETPLYRALRVEAVAGDVIDAWVRSDDLDAKLWILDAASRTLKSNDNADAVTRDAHVVYNVKKSGVYYLTLRDMNREEGQFRVSLAARPGAAPAANLYGFSEGAKVAAKGGGTNTRNLGPSYQCRRKTTPPIPCGGWVSVSTVEGKTQVALGVLGHSDFYTYVSGQWAGRFQDYPFPPAPNVTRFWNERARVELDATGHGKLEVENRSPEGGHLLSTMTYDVTAADGAITVSYSGTLSPQSGCNSYHETCVFQAVAP